MEKNSEPSLELTAEKTLLGQMLGNTESEDRTSYFIPAEDLPDPESAEFMPSEPLPPAQSYTFSSLSSNSINPAISVKYEQTGLSYVTGLDDIESLSGKVTTIEDSLKNVSNTMLNAFKSINENNAKAPDTDKFEERITVNLNNLIYNDRVSRTVDRPTWA